MLECKVQPCVYCWTSRQIRICLYCGELCERRVNKHLLEKYGDEPEVLEAFAKKGIKKSQAIERLENRGNYKHNINILRCHIGGVVLKAGPNNCVYMSYKDCSICPYCLGFFASSNLENHMKRCNFYPYSKARS